MLDIYDIMRLNTIIHWQAKKFGCIWQTSIGGHPLQDTLTTLKEHLEKWQPQTIFIKAVCSHFEYGILFEYEETPKTIDEINSIFETAKRAFITKNETSEVDND